MGTPKYLNHSLQKLKRLRTGVSQHTNVPNSLCLKNWEKHPGQLTQVLGLKN